MALYEFDHRLWGRAACHAWKLPFSNHVSRVELLIFLDLTTGAGAQQRAPQGISHRCARLCGA
eukprot:scaffold99150_cov20-Tisochrysis_lutea.AAC.3